MDCNTCCSDNPSLCVSVMFIFCCLILCSCRSHFLFLPASFKSLAHVLRFFFLPPFFCHCLSLCMPFTSNYLVSVKGRTFPSHSPVQSDERLRLLCVQSCLPARRYLFYLSCYTSALVNRAHKHTERALRTKC